MNHEKFLTSDWLWVALCGRRCYAGYLTRIRCTQRPPGWRSGWSSGLSTIWAGIWPRTGYFRWTGSLEDETWWCDLGCWKFIIAILCVVVLANLIRSSDDYCLLTKYFPQYFTSSTHNPHINTDPLNSWLGGIKEVLQSLSLMSISMTRQVVSESTVFSIKLFFGKRNGNDIWGTGCSAVYL